MVFNRVWDKFQKIYPSLDVQFVLIFIVGCALAWYVNHQPVSPEFPEVYAPYIEIPTVDISSFFTPVTKANKEEVEKRQREAARLVGEYSEKYGNKMFEELKMKRDDMIQLGYHLFTNVPSTIKKEYQPNSKPSTNNRGYLLRGAESGSNEYFEHKEGFSYGYDHDEKKGSLENDMEQYNQWPSSPHLTIDNIKKFNLFYDLMTNISF
ncbi:hypothetical protein RFI_17780, partial [Reticulomyxa filosa]